MTSVDMYSIDLSALNAFKFDAHDWMQFHNDLSSYTALVRIRNVNSEQLSCSQSFLDNALVCSRSASELSESRTQEIREGAHLIGRRAGFTVTLSCMFHIHTLTTGDTLSQCLIIEVVSVPVDYSAD